MRRTADLLSRFGLALGVPPLPPGQPGDPGLFGPGSAVWRIGRERVLLAGGPAALLLQLAHPLVAAGVAAHSDVRSDPMARLRATMSAVLSISFGDARQAETAAATVRAVHGRVGGRLGEPSGRYLAGTPYRAADPELAAWVHATLVWSALETTERLIRPVGRPERERYYREGRRFATLFGVTGRQLPPDYAGFERYWDAMTAGDSLAVSEEALALGRGVLDPPIDSVLRAVFPMLRALTAGLLPPRFARAFGLRCGPPERALAAAAATAVRATLPAWPARVRFWPHARVAVARVGRRRSPPPC